VALGLLLGRWWRITLPGLWTVALALWVFFYDHYDRALYGDGEQSTAFWLISGAASVFGAFVGVALHQGALAALRKARRA
jgi:hypothetical protein